MFGNKRKERKIKKTHTRPQINTIRLILLIWRTTMCIRRYFTVSFNVLSYLNLKFMNYKTIQILTCGLRLNTFIAVASS